MTRGASGGLDRLGAKLVDPEDREAYAELVSYVRALPPGDEFRQLGELLGLLTLLGQRLPEALSSAMIELRTQAELSGQFHRQLEQRLTKLPIEISAQIEWRQIAQMVAESFRQQVQSVGLAESTALLANTAQSVKTLTAETAAELETILRGYRGLASSLNVEMGKLLGASQRLQERNWQLLRQTRGARGILRTALLALLFLAGGLAGILVSRFHSLALSNNW